MLVWHISIHQPEIRAIETIELMAEHLAVDQNGFNQEGGEERKNPPVNELLGDVVTLEVSVCARERERERERMKQTKSRAMDKLPLTGAHCGKLRMLATEKNLSCFKTVQLKVENLSRTGLTISPKIQVSPQSSKRMVVRRTLRIIFQVVIIDRWSHLGWQETISLHQRRLLNPKNVSIIALTLSFSLILSHFLSPLSLPFSLSRRLK